MKKVYIIGTLVALALVVFGVTGYAYAQANDNGTATTETDLDCGMDGAGYGRNNSARGMMGSNGNNQGRSGSHMFNPNGSRGNGPIHISMIDAFAQVLGLTPEEVNANREAGETMWEIAEGQGLTTEQFQEMMTTVRTNAINQAVIDGEITQEQADFMLERMQRMMENGYGIGHEDTNSNHGGRWKNQP